MATIFGLSFTWNFTPGIVLVLVAVISLVFINANHYKIKGAYEKVAILFLLFYLYSAFIRFDSFVLQFILGVLNFLVLYGVLALPLNEKKNLLKIVSRTTTVLVAISLFGWILYLIGVPLPHSGEFVHSDNYHSYYNYYFFVMSPRDFNIIPRFMGLFKEPGHLAFINVLLILINMKTLEKSKIDVLINAISLIFSFSLAGWLVITIALLMTSFLEGKHRVLSAVVMTSVLMGMVFTFAKKDDSVVNEYIFTRLEYDSDSGFAGNNRTNDYFESQFNKFVQTSDLWLGIGGKLKESNDWTEGQAGWKVSIVHNGLIGFFIMNFVLCLYYYKFRSRHGFILLVAFLLNCYTRAYFTNPYPLFILLLAIPLMSNNKNERMPYFKIDKNLRVQHIV